MLKKQQRLSTASFNEVFKIGRRLHTPYFQVVYLQSTDFHASVVVGKKVAKTAVLRNRLRRQVYGVLSRCQHPDQLPYTLIVIAKPPLGGLVRREVVTAAHELVTLLRER